MQNPKHFRHGAREPLPTRASKLARCSVLVLFWVFAASFASAEPFAYSIMDEQLARLDLANGDVTYLGEVRLYQVGGMTMAADGHLWAFSAFSDDLWRIDPTSVEASRVGALGIDTSYAAGLTIDACGDLWLAADQVLYAVDRSTGEATTVADLTEPVVGLTSNGSDLLGLVPGQPARVGRNGLVEPFGGSFVQSWNLAVDFDAEDRLWAVYWYETVIIPSSVSLIFEIDPETGGLLSTTQAPALLNHPGRNLAISPPRGVCAPPVAIPVGDRGLMAFLMLLAAAGILVLGRR